MRNPFHSNRREQLAKFVESLLDEAAAPVPQSMRRFMPIYRRPVVQACAMPLATMATALRDDGRPVSDDALQALATFLTRGDQSALYGESPEEARRVSDLLVTSIEGGARFETAA